jgi:hypothetical protein
MRATARVAVLLLMLGVVATACGEGTTCDSATVALHDEQVERNTAFTHSHFDQPVGTVTITILSAQPVPNFEAPLGAFTVLQSAQGQFYGLRFELRNETQDAVMPANQMTDKWRLSDGERSWPPVEVAVAFARTSSSWAAGVGDPTPLDWVFPGSASVTWAVFDIPADTDPTSVRWVAGDGTEVCLALP